MTEFILARVREPDGAVQYVSRIPGDDGDGWGYTTNPANGRRVSAEVVAAFASDMRAAGAFFAVLNPFDLEPVQKSAGWR